MKRIEKIIDDLVLNGKEHFYIYPFGNRGIEIYKYICTHHESVNITRVDNKKYKSDEGIISYGQLVKRIREDLSDKKILLISSDNPQLYQEIRSIVNRDIDSKLVIDLYPLNSLTSHEDERVAALAMAGNLIYENNVFGAVAEAGVYRGDFAQYINKIFLDRKLYLFDTFDGFVEEQVLIEQDNITQTGIWIDRLKDTTVDAVLDKMAFKSNIVICRGVFPETIEKVEKKERFAFVNLDMDLYYPIYEGLIYFWDRMSPGGVIFVHDYGNWDGVTKAVRKFCRENAAGYVLLADKVTVAIPKPLI